MYNESTCNALALFSGFANFGPSVFHTNFCIPLSIADVNDCVPNPCQNNGVCTDGVNTVTCQCQPGFTGTNCETSKM